MVSIVPLERDFSLVQKGRGGVAREGQHQENLAALSHIRKRSSIICQRFQFSKKALGREGALPRYKNDSASNGWKEGQIKGRHSTGFGLKFKC